VIGNKIIEIKKGLISSRDWDIKPFYWEIKPFFNFGSSPE